MSDDFEQRLRTIFNEDDDPSVSERFAGEVRARIARIRRARSMRRALLALGVAAGVVAVVIPASQLAGISAMATAPAMINSGLSMLIASPVGYALGALATVAALADAFRD